MTKRVFTQTFGVVGALIEQGDKFLLVKENLGKEEDSGKWSHPAGWIDVGEDPIEAVKREVKEETGYDFEPTYVLGVYSLVRNDLDPVRHALKIIFTGKIRGEQAGLASDVSEVKWFDGHEIEQMDADTLRDIDIKKMVDDYIEIERHPLGLLEHTVAE